MKNSIFAFIILCGIAANAQAKKVEIKTAPSVAVVTTEKLSFEAIAQKNVADLAAFTPLTKDAKNLLLELFTTKGRMLEGSEQFSPERKAVVTQAIASKMESVLAPEVMLKLRANTALFKSLVN